MRKLREAAVVAAMVGSVSMLGAGVASAGGWEHHELPTVNCDQDNGDNTLTTNSGALTLPALLGTGGDADSSATQQICGIGNDDNENTSGDSTGGDGTDAA
jgi:hypothetical protein